MSFAEKHCVPCEGNTLPLFRTKAEEYLKEVSGWELSGDGKSISKELKFKNFVEAMQFANKVGDIAQSEGHHPDLTISWGKVGITLTTHSIKGLSENDFVLASKIDHI